MARRHLLIAVLVLCPALCSSGWRKAPARFNGPPIIIDAGHGGIDFGGVVKGVYEKNINLAVARKLRDILQERWSIPVKLTRNSDEFIRLDKRIDKSLAWKGALFVSLHVDKVRYKNVHGISVYSFKKLRKYRRTGRTRKKGLPYKGAPPRRQARRGAALSNELIASFKSKGFMVDPPKFQDYYVLKNPEIPSVLVEMGYLSHSKEFIKLQDPAYQERLAEAIARGLGDYLAKTSPIPSDPPVFKTIQTVRRTASPLKTARPAL